MAPKRMPTNNNMLTTCAPVGACEPFIAVVTTLLIDVTSWVLKLHVVVCNDDSHSTAILLCLTTLGDHLFFVSDWSGATDSF